jgi:hypothetical protein
MQVVAPIGLPKPYNPHAQTLNPEPPMQVVAPIGLPKPYNPHAKTLNPEPHMQVVAPIGLPVGELVFGRHRRPVSETGFVWGRKG